MEILVNLIDINDFFAQMKERFLYIQVFFGAGLEVLYNIFICERVNLFFVRNSASKVFNIFFIPD